MSKLPAKPQPSIRAQYMINMMLAHTRGGEKREFPLVSRQSRDNADAIKSELLEYIAELEQRPEINNHG